MTFDDKKVLLVEDNDMNRMLAGFLFKEFGIITEDAIDGNEAIEMIKNSAEGYYNLVMMDILMPNMCGDEATKIIRAMGRADSNKLPIIAMTAEADVNVIAKFPEKGFTDFIAKPMLKDELSALLEKYLG